VRTGPFRLLGCVLAVSLLGSAAPVRAEPVRLPNGTEITEVNFERHVASLLGKMGCNSGACHGSFQGKGGLYLSLFGYAPEKDYLAFTRDGMGRRINVEEPDRSLMLLKATGQVSHGGGKRFDKNSYAHRVIREWIAGGAKWQASGAVERVEVQPKEHWFKRPGETVALRVVVQFADGTKADLTPFCDFRAKDDTIAEVSPLGEVRGLRAGDTPVIISYRGNLVSARVLVPAPAEGFVSPKVPEVNAIDREVFAKLRKLNIVPSELSDDAEFLRRVTIDTVGCLPSPDEVRAFLADEKPDKRSKKIDELLAHPLHAALWATKFSDITGNNTEAMDGPPELRARKAKMWHDWFRKRVADNVPYDQIVHGVLCATSRDGHDIDHWIQQEVDLNQQLLKGFDSDYARRPSLDLFWRRGGEDDFFPLEQMAELTSAAFLGVRMECAQCHKHPYDRWTQTDYRAFANVFSHVKFGSSPEVTAAVTDLLAERRKLPPEKLGPPIPRLREVYISDHLPRRLPHPETNDVLKPRAPGGPEIDPDGDAREKLFQWLARPENPFFARSFANRVWAHYLGTGLVEPVDNFSLANPPSNEKLLDVLAKEFTDGKYDIRRLEKTILMSRTYQLSSLPNATNRRDRTNYSRAVPRRLMAEVVVDVLNTALGTTDDFTPDAPAGSRAIEVAPSRVRNQNVSHIFRIFGRPARTTTCDCERPKEPAVPQSLFLMTDPVLLKKLTDGRLKKLLADKKTDEDVIQELFLATLSRFPDDKEKQTALEHVRGAKDRQTGMVDTLWALINTREFILNH
jgi:hypothetical protein